MKTLNVALAVTILSACSGPLNFAAAPGTIAHFDRGRSWMARGAASIPELLYISDVATNEVYVYNYETGEEVGQLTGFYYPQGQCVDKKGDVWIANNANGVSGEVSVVEYAHGGSKPIAVLIPDGYPTGCSINPKNGSIAVADFTSVNSAEDDGDIEIWKSPSGGPKTYQNLSSCRHMEAPSYDDRGNLFTEGSAGFGTIHVCMLPAGGSELVAIPINHSIYGLDATLWDGKHIVFADSNYYDATNSPITAVYQAKVSRELKLSFTGTTILRDSCMSSPDVSAVEQPFVVGEKNTPVNRKRGSVIIGGNIACSGRFDFWAYPQGGSPASSLSSAPQMPEGNAVSFLSAQNR